MPKYTVILFALLFPCASGAAEAYPPLSVGIVSFNKSKMQISTTKNTLVGNELLICSLEEKSCRPYQGNYFSKAKPNDAVNDIATDKKIYTYSYSGTGYQDLQGKINLALIFEGSDVKPLDIEFDDQNTLKIKNHNMKNVISYCMSSEGIHVLSQPGNIHLYYYLGYDIEGNCPDAI